MALCAVAGCPSYHSYSFSNDGTSVQGFVADASQPSLIIAVSQDGGATFTSLSTRVRGPIVAFGNFLVFQRGRSLDQGVTISTFSIFDWAPVIAVPV